MKKWYAAYLVVVGVLCVGAWRALDKTVAHGIKQIDAIHAAQNVPAPTPDITRTSEEMLTQAKQLEQKTEKLEQLAAKIESPKSLPPVPQYYAPSCGGELTPLDGWNDQPKKDRPGLVHTELRYSRSPSYRAVPCLKPGQTRTLPYGTVTVHRK